MSFDWKQYLTLSRFLAGERGITFDREAAFRSAVSRAYYAAFCHARNYARDRHGFSPKGDVHDHHQLRLHFKNRAGFQRIAFGLDRLRQRRNSADYNDSVPSLPKDLAAALKEAADVLARLV